ncbi:MAG: hypothetical protein WAO98_04890 [Alphaproteobacteria bacterium]
MTMTLEAKGGAGTQEEVVIGDLTAKAQVITFGSTTPPGRPSALVKWKMRPQLAPTMAA